jgi:peptide deformylase
MQILQEPNETLHQVAQPVTQDELKDVVRTALNALKLLNKTDTGIGLAFNQIGDLRRCFVSTLPALKKVVINPEILEASKKQETFEEGCLSKPGKTYKVKRPVTIRARWISRKGTVINKTLNGMEARVFQHELDHLNGINIWDK